MTENPFGKVDETGTVFVKIDDEWREVGQYPDGTHEEALAIFERKFADLEGQVRLLEQRVRSGANAKDVAKSATRLVAEVAEAKAVGNLAALSERLKAITAKTDELAAQQTEQRQAELETAVAEREAIVVKAEQLAAGDLSKVQWKQMSADIDALFNQWKQHQTTGPRLQKSTNDALWKRFRAARNTLDAARRAFFAQQDAQHKDARATKQRLVTEAQALSTKGADGIPAYRSLLDRWKAAGRAGRKVDDALWAEFKAAGDVIYGAQAEIRAQEDAEYTVNLEAKRELLQEAQPILKQDDRGQARDALTRVQKKWDEIGRVPRDNVREVEDALRAIETHVRKLDEQHWDATNPERKARSEGMAGQLEESIEKLEAEIARAKESGDDKRVSELESELATKRQWLTIALAAG